MSVDTGVGLPRTAETIPLRRALPGFLRDPLGGFEEIGRRANGGVVRVNLGAIRPYLVTRPEHVQHVMQDHAANYVREGWLWKPLSRLIGEPSGSDPLWWVKRETFQTVVSGPNIAAFADDMAEAIVRAVGEMAGRAEGGRPVDAMDEMARIIYRAITRIFIGDKITIAQADRLGAALRAASAALRPRLMLPFVPDSVPLPGDRTFRRAVQAVDDIVFPIVRQAVRRGADGDDIVSMLIRARDPDGNGFDLRQLRDGVVSLFVAGTETTTIALTFLWQVLAERPEVAERLYEEVDRVVGDGPPRGVHLPELRYAKMAAQEMLRVFPPGWMLPRFVKEDDVIGGVRIEGGGIVVVSPYLTHRLPDVWEDPGVFDPERFLPGRERHRFAYVTFGGGPHGCVGKHFFTVETQFVIAAVLSRFWVRPVGSPDPRPALGLTLRPRERLRITLHPRDR